MLCPRCRTDLVVVEAEQVELDWCPACSGVWFDAGEIEVLLGGERPVEELLGAPPEGERQPDRRCPRCPRLLAKVSLGSTVLDGCPAHHGIWFDGGELFALGARAQTDEARAVVAHLVTTFGLKGDAP
jgi:uncharacterized protein